MEFFHAATPSFQIGEFMEFKKNDLVTVKIEDINLVENYLRVSGKLCFQILYIVDSEENRLASLEGKIPFEEMVYVTDMGKDEFFIKHVRTEFQTALIHSRKIGLHAMIELEIGRQQ